MSSYIYKPSDNFSLDLTLDCGQAFRWQNIDGVWNGVAGGRALRVVQTEDGIEFFDIEENDFNDYWKHYFDFDRDYNSICKKLSADSSLKTAIDSFPGIHILNQEPFETLISFIISQNNNIPRIKGIISRLCENFGEKKNGYYAFPKACELSKLFENDLAPLRAGFRNKYILDAAEKISSNAVSFEKIYDLPIESAEKELMKIKGVGPKVADCTLLYGFGKIDAFPVDVWVKRVMSEFYPNGLSGCTDGYRGIAQQYLFHYIRNK